MYLAGHPSRLRCVDVGLLVVVLALLLPGDLQLQYGSKLGELWSSILSTGPGAAVAVRVLKQHLLNRLPNLQIDRN